VHRPIPRGLGVALLACLFLAGCSRQAPPPAPPANPSAGVSSWSAFATAFLEAYYKAHPAQAVTAGRHDYDGLLPDWSGPGLAAEAARLHAERTRAASFAETALTADERFERDYLLARIDTDLFWYERSGMAERNPAFYLGMSDWGDSLDPSVYVLREYAPLETRARAFIRYAHSVVAAAAQIRANLLSPLPETYLHLGIAGFGGLADFYRNDVPKAFADLHDEPLKAELASSIGPAADAMQGLANLLKAQQTNAAPPYVLGAERFGDMLAMTEGVDVPITAIEAAGKADLARNRAALAAACASFAPGQSLKACVARQSAHKPDGGAVAAARATLAGLKQFVLEKHIVSVPGEEEALVREAPPFNRQNFAYIDIPGPFEHALPSVYYIAPPDPAWPKAERDAYVPGRTTLLFTSVHEVWPGHFLQFMHANRVHSSIGRFFVGYAFAEGWAHYAEELMWEKGLGGDPETHIGQLQEALLRNARLLSTIGIHTQGMPIAASEKLFREQALSDAGTARQQAARASYDPAYLNYTLGKLIIRRMREEYCATRGGETCWQEFHDRLLSYGGPPLPLVRRALLPKSTGALL
jgi:hypothetical protein